MTAGAFDGLLDAAGVERDIARRLARFGEMLLEANRRFNLSGAGTPEDLLPHLLDSLTLVPYIHEPYVDVGSGGGFPAIAVSIACGIPVTMIESTTKKAAFLRAALEDLGIRGTVVGERAEIAGQDAALREQFRTATARAVSSAPAVAELLLPLLSIGGAAVLQRGRLDDRERNAVTDAAPMLGGLVEWEREIEGERRILLLRKVSPTPGRFPRRVGIPEKRPLCF